MSPADLNLEVPPIAIAGGGLIGLSIAWRLAQRNFRVVVFDQAKIGSEASWAGAGMLAPGGEVDAPSRLATLAAESRALYSNFVRELEQETHLSVDYQECGALDLAYTASEWGALQARAAVQTGLGIESKVVGASQLSTFWPRVNRSHLAGALFFPQDGIVDPRELIVALTAACRKLGVQLIEGCAVAAAKIGQDSVTLTTAQGRKHFSALVVASGAWSSGIGVENVPALPLSTPVKGHLIGFHQPDQTCNTIIRHGHTYLLQRANGLLIAGASVENVGWDRSIKSCISASLAEKAGFVLPHLSETSPSETWIGFRPSSDKLHVESWHSNRLYLAYGHYRNGILLAPTTAQLIKDEISANLGTH